MCIKSIVMIIWMDVWEREMGEGMEGAMDVYKFVELRVYSTCMYVVTLVCHYLKLTVLFN